MRLSPHQNAILYVRCAYLVAAAVPTSPGDGTIDGKPLVTRHGTTVMFYHARKTV
jgi:hypothetical protein